MHTNSCTSPRLSLLSFASWVWCGPHTSVDRENVHPPPVIKFACSVRAACACFKIGDQLPHDGISSKWFKTRVKCVTCYISRRQVTWPKVEAIFRQNNTSTTWKILMSQKQGNSFKTIKDILLILPSKNNGILRITEAKFDGENRRNLPHTTELA